MWCNSYRMTAKYICVYLIDATCVQNYGKIGLMDFIKRFNPATIIRKKKKLLQHVQHKTGGRGGGVGTSYANVLAHHTLLKEPIVSKLRKIYFI